MTVRVDGQQIRALRVKHSYSQEKLAEIIGVNLRTIQRIETNGVASLSSRGALAWTIQALVTISLWAALELGVLLMNFRLRSQHS